jgi:hypothetical protein
MACCAAPTRLALESENSMTRHIGLKLALAVLMSGAVVASADAATSILKGGGIITGHGPSAACTAAFDVGAAFVIEYRPNFSLVPGVGAAETMTIFTAQMAFLITSTDAANKHLLGAGTQNVSAFGFGKGLPALASGPIPASAIVALPSPVITPSTTFLGLIETNIPNFGVAGCTVSFSAGLAKFIAPTPF